MKILIVILGLIFFQSEYRFIEQNNDFIVKYKFEIENNKTYLLGHIAFQKDKKNAINTNLMIEGHRIGTVPQKDGTFKLLIPETTGEILVYNTKYDKWQFTYKVKLNPAKDFTNGDN
jgi:hypothetical protein